MRDGNNKEIKVQNKINKFIYYNSFNSLQILFKNTILALKIKTKS